MAIVVFHRDQRFRSSDHHYYGMTMIGQYNATATAYRLRRVREQPLFLFMDLDRLFNDFEANVGKTYREVNENMVSDTTQGSAHL